MHYLSEFGEDPKPLPGEYPETHIFPGMETRAAATAWRRRAGHWAAPSWDPDPVVTSREYVEPPRYSWLFSPFERAEKALSFNWYYGKKLWRGNRSAKMVQRQQRMYKVKNKHLVLKSKKAIRKRNRACVRIQCCMRMYLGKKHVEELRILKNSSATRIQKHFRGYWCRHEFKIDQSAKCITRLFRFVRQSKMRDSVIAVLQIKKLFIRKMEMAVVVQRIIRGWLVRRRIWRAKWREFVNRRAAKVIQKHFREFLRLKYLVFWKPPGEEWVRARVAERLGNLLTNMMVQVKRRRQLMIAYQNGAPEFQRILRGFFARSGVKKMKYLRTMIRQLAPQKHAKEFLQVHMLEHLPWVPKPKPRVEEEIFIPPPVAPPDGFTRLFLAPNLRKKPDVDAKEFVPACKAWYKSRQLPMLHSEVDALCRVFANPMDGKVMVYAVDDFISLHMSQACRRHGRYVCGDCSFQRECSKCACQKYVNPGHKDGVCSACNHPPSYHRRVPLFLKKKNAKNMMRGILSQKREPDVSVPEGMRGVDGVKFVQDIAIRKIVKEHPELLEPGGFLHPGTSQVAAMARMAGGAGGPKLVEGSAQALDSTSTLLQASSVVDGGASIEGEGSTSSRPGTAESVMSISTVDSSVARRKAAEMALTTADLHQRERPKKFKTQFYDSQESKGKLPLYVQLARLTVDGDNMGEKLTDEYWDQNNMSMIHLAEDMTVPIHIQGNSLAPDTALSDQEFWKATERLPNKTMRDYDEKFEHSIPMPVVHDKGLTFTLEGSKLYLAILTQIATMFDARTLHYDNPDMVRLVVDHMQIFERHWRKMVKDIRQGTLHRHCAVSHESRELYEMTKLPQPEIAGELDVVFKHMGFHAKALGPIGKDVVLKPYALPKHTKLEDPRKRRLSLTHKTPGTMERVRAFSPEGRARSAAKAKRAMSPPPSSPTRRGRLEGKSMDLGVVKKEKGPLHNFRPGASEKERLIGLGKLMNSGLREEVFKDEAEVEIEGPSRRRPNGKRRGSEGDAYRPATRETLNAMQQGVKTGALDGERMKHLIEEGGRFVCPFPGCGQSFKNKTTALSHLPTHEQKMKLAAPTPLPDSHMHFYWPKGAPWQRDSTFTKQVVPVGSLPCPVPGCGQSFPSKSRLEAHMKVVHPAQSRLARDQAFYSVGGNCTQCPPFPPSDETPVVYCPNHTLPKGTCMLCVEIEKLPGPKPPFKFFEEATLNFKIRDGGGTLDKDSFNEKSFSGGAFDKGPEGIIKLHMRKQEVGVFCRDVNKSTGQVEEFRGRLANICQDGKGDGWVAVRRYYTHDELVARGETELLASLPRDFDRKRELVFSEERVSEWHRMTTVMGQVNIYDKTRDEFRAGIKQGVLPKKNAYFSRPLEDSESEDDDVDGGGW